MFGDIRGFGLLSQHVGFFLPHLTAAHHIRNEVARTIDGKVAQPRRGPDHVTHGPGHLAARLQADLMRPLRHFGCGVARVGGAVPRATARRRTGRRGVPFGDRVVVGLRQIGHGWSALLPPAMEVAVVV